MITAFACVLLVAIVLLIAFVVTHMKCDEQKRAIEELKKWEEKERREKCELQTIITEAATLAEVRERYNQY